MTLEIQRIALRKMQCKTKDYHHGALKRALIESAVRTIAKHGISALNLRELAAAGVSPGAPYHHFADREHLLSVLRKRGS